MKKLIIGTIILLPLCVNAFANSKIEKIHIERISTQLDDFNGHISADYIDIRLPATNIRFDQFNGSLSKNYSSERLKLSQHKTSLEFTDFRSDSFSLFRDLKLEDTSFYWNNRGSLELFMSYGSFQYKDNNYEISRLDFICTNNSRSVQKTTLESCINHSRLRLPKIDLDDFSKSLFIEIFNSNEGQSLIQGLALQGDYDIQSLIPNEFTNIKVDINSSVYEIEARAEMFLRPRLRVNGHIQYDLNSTYLVIKIDRARLGIIPVKSSLLKQLRSQGLKVENDSVYIPI